MSRSSFQLRSAFKVEREKSDWHSLGNFHPQLNKLRAPFKFASLCKTAKGRGGILFCTLCLETERIEKGGGLVAFCLAAYGRTWRPIWKERTSKRIGGG